MSFASLHQRIVEFVNKKHRTPQGERRRTKSLRLEHLEVRELMAADVLYRVNAGGSALADGWGADTSGSPSPYGNASAAKSTAKTVSNSIDMSHASVPTGTSSAIFKSERYDESTGADMQWNFAVTPGTYEVRLYFAETHSKSQKIGGRVFDVQIEGQTVLDNYDVFADVGGNKGVVKSFTINADSNIDVDFLRGVQNPSIKGIEILTTQVGNQLGSSQSSLSFPGTLIGNTVSKTVTLTNVGSSGDPSITVDPQQMQIVGNNAAQFSFSTPSNSPVTLAPGETLTVTVRFTAPDAAAKSATLRIPHTGTNSPLEIGLSGAGVATVSIGFGKSQLGGEISDRPTSMQFGPDGKLYVANQDGLIEVYTIVRNGANDYDVVSTQTITSINTIVNHNDDGTVNSSITDRLVTGLLVTGTASNPVIYVCSSDPRIGAGPSGNDLNLDTNSGILSRLTWNGSSWVKVDLVRGLPRSEENHASNGMALDPVTNTLYIAQGGHTNMGAPSNNFALLPEYALSAAILSVNLNAIGNTTYNIPTLDDENRATNNDANDPFGGNDGKNQARLVPGGPVQVYAPGFRNPYDLVITSSGKMYTIDNGPNGGWGNVPKNEGPAGNATNERNEPGNTHPDGLHLITGPGYYGGHPNPTRSNMANTFNTNNPQSPVSQNNAIESDYRAPGAENGALFTWGSSTNGLTEYRASNFQGAMKGNLLAASFDNSIKRIVLNAAGTSVVDEEQLFNSVGSTPLDVTTIDDNGIFPGTIWVCDIVNGNIYVFEPNDFGGGVSNPPPNPDDLDGDGYLNDDEIANGTNPNSSADRPADFDLDFVSNLLDNDDDNDSLLDTSDAFAIDANNGLTTPVGVSYLWENEGLPAGGLLNMGFTGLMTNGASNYASLYDTTKLTAGGAAGVLTLDDLGAGDALGSLNTQQQAFQFGVNVAAATGPFSAHTRVLAPFSGVTPTGQQSMGMFIGTGDQDNYLKIVLTANNGNPGITYVKEVNGVVTNGDFVPLSLPGIDMVDLYLTVDKATSTVQAGYKLENGTRINLGSPVSVPASWLSGAKALAVGIISSRGTAPPISATWDFLEVIPETVTPPPIPGGTPIYRVNAGGGALTGGWTADTKSSPSQYGNASAAKSTALSGSASINMSHPSLPAGTPSALFQSERYDETTGSDMQWNFAVTPGTYEVRLYFAETHSKSQKVGGRVFDVQIEGQTVLDNYDVFADVGANKGVMKSFIVTADNNIDVDFLRGTQNPSVKGIEIVKVSAPGTLGVNLQSHDFGSLVVGQTETLQIQLTNQGVEGDPSIVIDRNNTVLSGAGSGQYIANFTSAGAISLAPGQSTLIEVTFRPTVVGPAPTTLTIPHSGSNGAIIVAISGQGIAVPTSNPVAVFEVDSGGSMDSSSTYGSGSFKITNNSPSGLRISSVRLDMSKAFLPDIVFDPDGTAGDPVGKGFTADSGASQTGLSSNAFSLPLHTGYQALDLAFTNFDPGETFTFSADIDPSTIRGAAQPGPEESGSVSGFEMIGSQVTITFSDGSTLTSDLYRKGTSTVGSVVTLKNNPPAAPGLSFVGIGTTPATTGTANQTLRVTGTAGQTVQLLRVEGALHLSGVPGGGYDVDPYESNKAISASEQTVTIGASGFVDVPVTLTRAITEGGYNHFIAVVKTADGQTGESAHVLLKYEPGSNPPPPVPSDYVYRINAGGGALSGGWLADTNGSPSPYSNASAASSTTYSVSTSINTSHSSVPVGTPAALFQTERFDQTAGSDMQWNFAVDPGNYVVRLFFAETYSGAFQAGTRVFDVQIEGQTVLDNYDVWADVGANTGVVKSFNITADGNIDVDFLRGTQNPAVKGIEIVRA
jgi:hypothetical protein